MIEAVFVGEATKGENVVMTDALEEPGKPEEVMVLVGSALSPVCNRVDGGFVKKCSYICVFRGSTDRRGPVKLTAASVKDV